MNRKNREQAAGIAFLVAGLLLIVLVFRVVGRCIDARNELIQLNLHVDKCLKTGESYKACIDFLSEESTQRTLLIK